MTKKEIMKHYKKGTEIKLVTMGGDNSEIRGHVTGYWRMMDNGWGIEVLIVGQEKPIQVATEDVIRVFKDKEAEPPTAAEGEVKDVESQEPSTPVEEKQGEPEVLPPDVIVVNPGDVVDDDGNIVRRAPQADEPHSMEKPAATAIALDAETTEELNKLDSVAAKIRFLLGKGMGRSQVAKTLGVGYRYVYAIEHKPLKRELPLVIIPHNKAE